MRLNRRRRSLGTLATGLLSVLLADGVAFAQPEASDATEESDETEESRESEGREKPQDSAIEEITVTAQKRSQSLQDVPVSVTALSSDFIEKSSITQFDQLNQFAPNLQIRPVTDTRSTSIRIRGIGSVGSNAGIDPSVGVFIDGVYQGRAGMSVGDLMDIEQIEVLRGPQGTLYGKNTAAGAITIRSKKPSYDYEAMFETVLGNYSNAEVRGSINIPVVDDRFAMRVSGYYAGRDGFDINAARIGSEFIPPTTTPPPGVILDIFPTVDPIEYLPATGIQDVNNDERFGFKGAFLLDITETASLELRGDYAHTDNRSFVADINGYPSDDPNDPNYSPPSFQAALTFEQLEARTFEGKPECAPPNERSSACVQAGGRPLPDSDGFDRIVYANHQPKNVVNVFGGSAEFNEDIFDDHLFTALLSGRHYDTDASFDGDFSDYDAVLAKTTVDLNQTSLELRLTSPGGETLEYQAGFYFFYMTMNTTFRNGTEPEAWAQAPLLRLALPFDRSQTELINIDDATNETFSYAGFGQGTWRILDELAFIGGLRVTHEQKLRVGTQRSNSTLPVEAPPLIGPPVDADDSRSVTNLSGLAKLQYNPTDDIMAYVSFASGFKSGGFNQLRTIEGQPFEFEDELSLSYEAGIRTSWWDRKLTANLTGYYTDYDDFQSQAFNGTQISVRNAGAMQSYGFESEITVIPWDWLTSSTGIGFNIAEYKTFKEGEATVAQIWEATGGMPPCSAALDQVCTQDLTGRVVDNAPRWSLNSALQLEEELPGLPSTIYLRTEWSFQSEVFLAQDLDPHLEQASYHLLNFRAGLRDIDDGWQFGSFVTNVTNESYAVAGFDVPIINGFAVVNGPPRQFGGRLRVSW